MQVSMADDRFHIPIRGEFLDKEFNSCSGPHAWVPNGKMALIELREHHRLETLKLWAVIALVKYWNPDYRLFTFLDMDMVPTLEEYAELLEIPISLPLRIYAKIGGGSAIGRLTQILRTSTHLVVQNLGEKNGVQGWVVLFY